jgi:hypothetical protein
MYEGAKPALSKVPEVTLGFWVIKILGTTIGETGGDAVTMSLFHADKDANNGGYLIGTCLFMAVFIATVAIQITMKRFGQCRKGYRSRPLRKWRLVRDRPGHADGHSLGDGHGMVNLRHVKVSAAMSAHWDRVPARLFHPTGQRGAREVGQRKGQLGGNQPSSANGSGGATARRRQFPATARSGSGSAADSRRVDRSWRPEKCCT